MKTILSFTLIEALVALIALAILVAVAIPVYQNILEQTRIDICTANQEALLEAIKIYDMKYDTMPSSLAKAWRKNGDKALAIVWQKKKKKGDYIYLAYISFQKFKYCITNIFSFDTLNAQPAFSTTLADKNVLKCPSDTNGPPSYAFNTAVANMRYNKIPSHTIIVADSDLNTFSVGGLAKIVPGPMPVVPPPFANRHNGGYISTNASGTVLLTTPAGVIVLKTGGGN